MFERFTDEARHAVVAAQTEARTLEATRIETIHLFLGVLVTAGPELTEVLSAEGYTRETVRASLSGKDALGERDARALESIGIDLDAVRAPLEASFGEGALDRPDDQRGAWFRRKTGHIAFASGSKKALHLSLREALARNNSEIGCEHILLGLIGVGDDAFTAVVLEPEHLKKKIEALVCLA
ncbi:MAG: Clp protease N-terminal domain-containing protein [Rhodococcus sp. (in: high G+C Gram-positive bacteria)]